MSQEACSSVSKLTVAVFPDTLSSAPSNTTALKTPDPQILQHPLQKLKQHKKIMKETLRFLNYQV